MTDGEFKQKKLPDFKCYEKGYENVTTDGEFKQKKLYEYICACL